jgi:tryptophanyl-tRNA synthetase
MEPVIPDVGARVMGLDNPDMKMSKTSAHIRGHSIGMLDDPKEIERSIKRSVTDSMNEIEFSDDPSRAGVNNLLGIYKAITGKNKSEVEADFHDASGYGELKQRVSDVIIDELTPIRERYHELMKDVEELDRLLHQGAEQAKEISMTKLNQIKNCVGLTTPK